MEEKKKKLEREFLDEEPENNETEFVEYLDEEYEG